MRNTLISSRLLSPPSGRLNLTPMMDIVFQLLVFFMVASNLATVEFEPIDLPRPTGSLAKEQIIENRITINLFSDSTGRLGKIKVNAEIVRDLPALIDLLLRSGPVLRAGDGTVVIRADKTMHFSEIEKVLQAVANAGVGSIHIAAEQAPGTGDIF